MIVDDFVKLTLINGGSYGRGEYVGNHTCSVQDGNMVIEDSDNAILYRLDGNYKIIRYHGYLLGSIVMLDGAGNVLHHISGEVRYIEFVVPDGCSTIYFCCAKDYENKYYLQLFTSSYYDVTNYVDNWDSLEVILSRDNTSGVISEVSFEFEFVDAAREFLRRIFNEDGLYSQVAFTVHRREDKSNRYELVKEMNLDFSTYQLTKDRVKISSSNNTLLEIINSEGKTEYEIPVSEIREKKKWDYSRVKLINNAEYQIPDEIKIDDRTIKGFFNPTITTNSVELAPGSVDIDFVEQNMSFPDSTNNFPSRICKNVGSDLFTINVRLKCRIKCSYHSSNKYSDKSSMDLRFLYSGPIANTSKSFSPASTIVTAAVGSRMYSVTHTFDIDTEFDIFLWGGREISFSFYFEDEISNLSITSTQEHFILYYQEHDIENKKIDVISPDVLLQRYLDEMSGVKGLFRGEILWKDEPYKTMIVAAESIRQMPKARIYGKPNDFFNWMRVLGYEYEIEGNVLTFRERDSFFTPSVALSMREDEVADLIEQADSEYAYTSLEIGYDKQDYDGLNGRLEPNGTFSYTTGYVTREDNKLSLISPYRADSIGIEYLCHKDMSNTKDDESDNDIFFVALTENDSTYEEYKDLIIKDNTYPVDLFNAVFLPCFLVDRNKSLIGINAKMLKFKSSDMSNSSLVSGDSRFTSPYVDIELNEKLFEPIIYNFAAGSHKDMPPQSIRNGLISIQWNNEEYLGYIKEIRKNYAKETETTWELHAYKARYTGKLEVTPQFVWINPNEPGIFTVVSDTDWYIEN